MFKLNANNSYVSLTSILTNYELLYFDTIVFEISQSGMLFTRMPNQELVITNRSSYNQARMVLCIGYSRGVNGWLDIEDFWIQNLSYGLELAGRE